MRQARKENSYIRKIDYIFYREKAIRRAVKEVREDSDKPRIRQVGQIGDPTATEAIRNMKLLPVVILDNGERIESPEAWIKVIDKTYEWSKSMRDSRYETAIRRYRKEEDYRKTCAELNISQTTYARNIERVRMYAALHAYKLNLIEVL